MLNLFKFHQLKLQFLYVLQIKKVKKIEWILAKVQPVNKFIQQLFIIQGMKTLNYTDNMKIIVKN